VAGAASAPAQSLIWDADTIVLRSGETATIGSIYFIANCKSVLRGTPKAEIVEGPPGLTVTVKEAMVTPRPYGCPNKVAGGTLTVSARDIEDPSVSTLTIRIIYPTKDGDRQRGQVFNLSLVP
jgi:hypothetical protein